MTPVANLPPVSLILLAICHRRRWHRRQIMGTISGCGHLKVNLKAKIYIYVSSTTPPVSLIQVAICHRCQKHKGIWWQNLPPVSLIPGANLIWYTHKTSGFKRSGFKTSGFKTFGFKTSGLQNVRFTKRQVSKCLVSKRLVFKFDILIK